ncbi:hypothetical protein ACFJIX_21755 [Roseateles sp. UC29_93]|uniref:hypothetical protein n=1 Tax=Roseateles sp. UC29_93 TaxID=3350177 RepID=UPI00367309BC
MKLTSLGAAGDPASASDNDMAMASATDPSRGPSVAGSQHVLGVDFSQSRRLKPANSPIAFQPGEELGRLPQMPASGDARHLIGEVAAALGQSLLERYDWDRPVAIDSKAVATLLKSPHVQGKQDVQWELKADARADKVLLVARSGGKPVAQASVLDLSKIPPGMVILCLEPDDNQIKTAQGRLTDRYNAGGHTLGCLSVPEHLKHHAAAVRPLHGLPSQSRIMLVGHGKGRPDRDPNTPFSIGELAHMNVRQIADRLAKDGLQQSFAGTLYLESCGSGSGFGDGSSFAQSLQAELFKRGYRQACVAGLPGKTHLWESGQNESQVDALSTDVNIALQQSKRTVGNLKKTRQQHSESLTTGKLTSGGRRQDQVTQSLTAALNKEKKHIAALKTLKGLVNRGLKKGETDAQRRDKILASSGVLNWWGRLGPGASKPKPPKASKG